MSESPTKIIKRARSGIDLYLPAVMNVHRDQVRALYVVKLCADRAHEAGDLSEAARLYHYLYTELQSLWHFADSREGPDYVEPPVPVDRWVTAEILSEAAALRAHEDNEGAAQALYLLLPRGRATEIIGDLDEEYLTHVLPRFGRVFASRWYARQVIVSVLVHWGSPFVAFAANIRDVVVEVAVRVIRGG